MQGFFENTSRVLKTLHWTSEADKIRMKQLILGFLSSILTLNPIENHRGQLIHGERCLWFKVKTDKFKFFYRFKCFKAEDFTVNYQSSIKLRLKLRAIVDRMSRANVWLWLMQNF